MTCPKCNGEGYVKDTRVKSNRLIYRRQNCKDCGYRFTTYEMPDMDFKVYKMVENMIAMIKEGA